MSGCEVPTKRTVLRQAQGPCPQNRITTEKSFDCFVKKACHKIRSEHYSFWMDVKMIFATVLGRKIEFAGEEI